MITVLDSLSVYSSMYSDTNNESSGPINQKKSCYNWETYTEDDATLSPFSRRGSQDPSDELWRCMVTVNDLLANRRADVFQKLLTAEQFGKWRELLADDLNKETSMLKAEEEITFTLHGCECAVDAFCQRVYDQVAFLYVVYVNGRLVHDYFFWVETAQGTE